MYDWGLFQQTMRTQAPNTVIFSDIGPDIRWVGNENGIAGDPNWDLLDTAGFMRGLGAPPNDTLNHGNMYGKNWIPAECDVSIRPGWFYHAHEDAKVKDPDQLFQLWLKSVGRGANLLLNVPPDRRGMINASDSIALMGFRKLREREFSHAVASQKFGKDHLSNPVYNVQFNHASPVNCVVIRESIDDGQHIIQFRIDFLDKNQKLKSLTGKTVGHKRILTFPSITCSGFALTIESQKKPALITQIEAFRISDQELEK